MDTPNPPAGAAQQPAVVIPATPPAPPQAGVVAGGPPYPRRRGGGWWVAGCLALVLLALLGGCCVLVSVLGGAGQSTGPVTGGAVAVIHIDSVIQDGGSSSVLGGSSGVTPEGMIKQLRRADNDPRIKAVLLRINSPGGTVSASQEIAMEVERMRKPVIADIGDVGASGAYYVAAQCDRIVASPSSAVGSIGVILEVPDLQGLLQKIGVKVTVLKEGKYKDAGSPYRDLTPQERKIVQDSMKPAYDQFIADVAKGRKLPEAKVHELATGQAWPGVQAKDLGLVDEIGNYTDAVRAAGKAGGISGEPAVVQYDATDLLGVLSRLTGALERLAAPGASAADLRTAPVAR